MKVLLLLFCSLLILSSCRNNTSIKGRYGEQYWIDTLTIHGNLHEIIVSDFHRTYNGFIHSPECWCLTKKDKQND